MRNSEGKLVSGKEALEVWKESFQKLGEDENTNTTGIINFFRKQVEEEVKQIRERDRSKEEADLDLGSVALNRPIEKEEVSSAISKLKNGKAVGIDGINSEMLKGGGVRVCNMEAI
jgi:hypothetical protein